MLIYDISMWIDSNMAVYKGRENKQPKIKILKNHDEDNIKESEITFSLHTGTHIDAPLHMIKDGQDISYFKCENMISSCKVIDFTEIKEKIEAENVSEINVRENEFLLFKTKNSGPGFLKKHPKNFIYIDKEAAKLLVEKNLKGIGVDSLGVERNQPNHPTHKMFLKNNIVIVEGLRLAHIPEGEYNLLLAPLKIKGAEGSPVRALLIKED